MKKITGLAMLIGCIGLSSANAANIVVNGSFEDTLTSTATLGSNVVSAGSWSIFNSLTGWSSTQGIEVRNNAAGAAYDGSKYVELDVYTNTTIAQTLNTVSGQQYELSFWYSPREGQPANTNGVSWAVGGTNGSINGPAGVASGNQWAGFTQTFTATSTSTVLSFTGLGTANGFGTSLDAVSVSAVPEPSDFAMMLAGLAVVGAMVRKRAL
jgi:Protein of unknown function (DUF642)